MNSAAAESQAQPCLRGAEVATIGSVVEGCRLFYNDEYDTFPKMSRDYADCLIFHQQSQKVTDGLMEKNR